MQDNELESWQAHVAELGKRWSEALVAAGFDAVVLPAGAARNYLFDDQAPPFRPNPHFAQWYPGSGSEHGALVYRPGQRARLYLYQPRDFWHLVPSTPEWAATALEVRPFDDEAALGAALADDVRRDNRVALIGEEAHNHANLGGLEVNPPLLLNRRNWSRAFKTGFELDSMRKATSRAVAGHRAAFDAFHAGASEFDINLAYLAASRQSAADLPYSNIVALNDHAGVLHYQFYDREPPAKRLSFLIDAGASWRGYAADVTRTFAASPGLFADLIEALDAEQRDLIASIKPGVQYLDLHADMHRRIAELLARFDLVTCSAEAACQQGITRAFLPHGLGHLLGLQTHDVAGQQSSPDGGHNPPPDNHAALRLTRAVGEDMAFTIEPGMYFIPLLLDALRGTPPGADIVWSAVDPLIPFGGIRIEDNVVVTASGVINLTRDAFAAVD
jgi:Xaa-Pro dipeptidase